MSAWVYLKNIYFVTKEMLGIRRSSEYEVRKPNTLRRLGFVDYKLGTFGQFSCL